jgi:hypothetical protein
MSFYNGVYTSPIVTQQNLDPSEAIYSNILGTSNDFTIAVQIASSVNRTGYPLPDPEENPTHTYHISLYPLGYSDVRDTSALVDKTISASGEDIVKTVKFNVVGLEKCQLRITNANSFGVVIESFMTEAKLT